MSLLHEMLDAQARIAELETEVERVTKNFECYERSLTDIREALGLSAEDDHECVLDEIKRLRRERDGALAKLRRYDSGEEMPEALRPENIHPSDDVVAASSRMRSWQRRGVRIRPQTSAAPRCWRRLTSSAPIMVSAARSWTNSVVSLPGILRNDHRRHRPHLQPRPH